MDHAAIPFVHAVQRALAERVQPAAESLALVWRRRQHEQLRAEHRHQRHGHEQRHQQREDHDDRQLAEHEARDTGQEEQRHEHGDVRQDRRQNRRPHFLAAVDRRRHPVLAVVLHVPERVLQHDDRRVHHHADPERQSAERHRVQREPREVEQRERADHRDGDRGADNQRRSEIAQEQEDDDDDQDRPDHHVLFHRVDRAFDELGAVLDDRQLDAGHFAVDASDLRPHELRDLDRVRPRLLLDLHAHTRASVDAHHRPDVLGGVLHVRDVLHVHGDARLRQQDEIADLIEVRELALAPDQVRHVAAIDLAERDVLVLRLQDVHDAIDREIERLNLFLRELDVNLPAEAAVDGHRRDPGDALEPWRQRVLGELAQRHAVVVVALDPEAHDRL